MLPEALVGLSLAIGGYQDLKHRTTADWVWLPAALGLFSFAFFEPSVYPLLALRIGGVFVLSYLAFRRGLIGDADVFGFSFAAVLPSLFGYFFAMGVFALVGLGAMVYVYAKKPREEAKKYGYPFVTFLAVGFVAAVLFLAWALPFEVL